MRIQFIIPCFIAFIFMALPLTADEMESHVVKITVAYQSYDYNSPWQKRNVKKHTIAGCVIDGQRILTVSYSLVNHVFVEVTKKGGTRKYAAEVVVKDYHNGLAILKVKDKEFFSDLKAPEIFKGKSISAGKTMVYRWDRMGSFKKYSAELNKSSIRFFNPKCGVLMHQFSTGMIKGGNGVPVFVNGKLAGITTGADGKNKTIYVIGVDVIQRMLADLSDGTYEGYPFFWVKGVAIESDEGLREYLGMSKNDEGVLVTYVPAISSGAGSLKRNDVILSINGVNINDNGMYQSEKYGSLNYAGLLFLDKFVGDTIKMRVLRNKKKRDISFKLKQIPDNCCKIPLISYDSQPNYYILGGLIFQELSIGYMETWGAQWKQKANKRLLYWFENITAIWAKPDINRIVVLNRVLPFPINNGYQGKREIILEKVNGKKIKDLLDFKRIVGSLSSRFIRLDFIGGDTIILDRKEVESSEAFLLRRYNIHSPFSIEN
ncbi:PDZ domain-containing protein [Spirochaetota bacterium]